MFWRVGCSAGEEGARENRGVLKRSGVLERRVLGRIEVF